MEEWSPFRAYARRSKLFCWQDLLTLTLLFLGIAWFFLASKGLPAYSWNWQACENFLFIHAPEGDIKPGLLLQGLFTTLRVGFWTFIFSLFVGLILGFYAVGKTFWEALPYYTFINLLRNTPPLILLFCVYFIFGKIVPVSPIEDFLTKLPIPFQQFIAYTLFPSGEIDRMCSAILALGLYQSAYVAEIIRGALESVPKGQWDAGLALGFSKGATILRIIAPQGMRLAIPPLTGQCITTFKESSLASLISLPDLTFQSLEIMAVTGLTFEVWLCAGILYLLLGGLCAVLGAFLEKNATRYI